MTEEKNEKILSQVRKSVAGFIQLDSETVTPDEFRVTTEGQQNECQPSLLHISLLTEQKVGLILKKTDEQEHLP